MEDISKYVSDGFEAAKSGEGRSVYNSVAELFSQGLLPAKSHYPFGWIIYYALHQTPDAEIVERKKMLATYLRLRVTVPHKLHSMILTEAIRLYKDSQNAVFNNRKDESLRFSILKFLQLWDPANLRPGDWKRKEVEGKMLSSTVEKLITVLADESETTHTCPAPEIIALIDKGVEEYGDSSALYVQRSAVYILEGKRESATAMLKKALLLAPGKFHIWGRLGGLVEVAENPNLHISLLHRAVSTPGPEEFKGRVRLSLAKAFVELKAYPYALWELEQVRHIYETKGWHLPQAYKLLLGQIPQDAKGTDPSDIYRRVAGLADDFIYSELPTVIMAKTYHKLPDNRRASGYGTPAIAWRLTGEDRNNVWFTPSKFGIDPNLPSGTRIGVKLFNGKVVKAELA